jgi:hypothetical protein
LRNEALNIAKKFSRFLGLLIKKLRRHAKFLAADKRGFRGLKPGFFDGFLKFFAALRLCGEESLFPAKAQRKPF